MVNQLHHATHTCKGPQIQLADLPTNSVNTIWDKWINKVFKTQQTIVSKELISETANYLVQGIMSGYTTDIYTSPDINMIKSLLSNTWQFAGFKINSLSNHVGSLLVDDTGAARSFDSFKKEAAKVGVIYNQNWLRTEYQHAVAASQSAAKWVNIQATKDTLPLLQYDTAGDNKVRANHAALDGIIRPINDSFWSNYMPPWEWACRCTVRQLAGGKITAANTVTAQTEKAGPSKFKALAQNGVAFAQALPFFDVSDTERTQLTKIVAELAAKPIKERVIELKQQVYAMPIEKQYTTLKQYKNGGAVQMHVLADKGTDWDDLIGIANYKAQLGDNVKILPKINESEVDFRNQIMPGNKWPKNADLLVNGELVEVKSTNQFENLMSLACKGATQANEVCVILNNGIDKPNIHLNSNILFDKAKRPDLKIVELFNYKFDKVVEYSVKIKKGK